MQNSTIGAVTDDSLLIKYKTAGLSDEFVARKLGWTVEQVQQRLLAIVKKAEQLTSSGYEQLSNQFLILVHQYQLLGESLKLFALGLNDLTSVSSIAESLDKIGPKSNLEVAEHLSKSFIILNPFKVADPNVTLQDSIKRQQEGN